MKIQTRLWLHGAAVPAGLLLTAFLLAGMLFERLLLESIDRTLLAQAAVESVSLFDRLAHQPHLHLDESPLQGVASQASATSALYGPDGARRVQFPHNAKVPAKLMPGSPGLPPQLTTVVLAGAQERVLEVTVLSPENQPHALRLAAPLDRHRATMALYFQAVFAIGLLVTVVLVGVQSGHARRLGLRIRALGRHMQKLRAGDLAAEPAPDTTGDELTELRDAVAETTERLRAFRNAQQRLIADAAHELRTPLAAMRTEIDVTLRRPRSPDELREALQRVREEVGRLTGLARQLLDLTVLQQAQAERTNGNVVALVDEAVRGHAALAAERKVTLKVQAPPALHARFEPAGVRQVVDNLLSNALKVAPAGSEVEVVVAPGENGAWALAIRDHGPGVPESEREAIFEPFHRPLAIGEGTGLGLAIVREVAKRHGGGARVEAAEGGGARFVVEWRP